tara:strand:+ start:954 stop:1382 length:429 start_codon:yes stop_codon:yes gene_type:complete
MSYKTNTNQNADIAEDIVKLEIKRKGWVHLTPSSRDTVYDLVVDIDGDYQSIQVKKMTNHILPRGVWRGNQRTTMNGKTRNSVDYAKEKVDWLVGVDIETSKTFWYNLDNYGKKKEKSFKVTSKRHPSSVFPVNNSVRKNNE